MGIWLPESRFEMPELFEPGRKPVGDVKIDNLSALGKILTQENSIILLGDGGYRELLTENKFTNVSGIDLSSTKGYSFSASTDRLAIGSSDFLSSRTEMSLIIKIKQKGALGGDLVHTWAASVASQIFLTVITDSPKNFSFAIAKGSLFWGRQATTTTIDQGNDYTIAMSWRHDGSSNSMDIFINGVEQSQSIWFDHNPISLETSSGYDVIQGGRTDVPDSATMDADLTVVANVALPKQLLRGLSLHPYQFLIPA